MPQFRAILPEQINVTAYGATRLLQHVYINNGMERLLRRRGPAPRTSAIISLLPIVTPYIEEQINLQDQLNNQDLQ